MKLAMLSIGFVDFTTPISHATFKIRGDTVIVFTTSDISCELQRAIANQTKSEVVQNKISKLNQKDKSKAEILITYGNFDDAITAEDISQLIHLKWIHVLSSGTEQLPKEAIRSRKIHVTSSKGIHAIPISEYVVCSILYFAKKIEEFRKLQKQRAWSYSMGMSEIYGKTLGILGTGYIGREIAKKAKALGMSVIGVNRSGNHSDEFDQIYKVHKLKEILPAFDYICSVLPSTDETKHLIDRGTISHMKDGVIFINAGRGDVAVEKDLLESLRTGKISGAALDVFEEEPLESCHPFWAMENVLVTPHASARTEMYMERALNIFLDNFKYYQDNDLKNMVNKVNFQV